MPETNSSSTIAAEALSAISGTPALVPTGALAGQPVFPLDRLSLLAGSSPYCELRLAVAGIAPFHALMVTYPGGVFLRNMAAAEQVVVNGRPILEHRFSDGDQIQFGPCTFQFAANGARFQSPEIVPTSAIEAGPAGAKLLTGFSVILGRRPGCDVQILDPIVEECHAVLFAANGKWNVRDLNSQTGTRVNDARVFQKPLNWGDTLGIGNHPLRLVAVPIDPSVAALSPAPPAAPPVAPPPSPAAPPEEMGGGEMFLGGMPVQLPEVAAPQGFGRINISFEGKSLNSQLDRTSQSRLPAEEILKNIAAAEAARPTAAAIEDSALPRTPVLRNFPPVPKIKRAQPSDQRLDENNGKSAGSFEGAEDSPPSSATLWEEYANRTAPLASEFGAGPEPFAFAASPQPLPTSNVFTHTGEDSDFNEADFSGQPLANAGGLVDDSLDSNWHGAEIEDFSADQFWDQTADDSRDVPLPHRERDLAPPIPPSGTTATSLGGLVGAAVVDEATSHEEGLIGPGHDDVFSADEHEPGGNGRSNGEAAHPHRVAAHAPVNSQLRPAQLPTTPPPQPTPRAARAERKLVPLYAATSNNPPRRRRKTLLGLCFATILAALAAGAIYTLIPTRGIVEDRLEFLNTPTNGTPAWQAFEADELHRLANTAIRDDAALRLKQDYPSDTPGLLQGDPAPFNKLASEARFTPAAVSGASDLVLRLAGENTVEDGQRLTALMKAMYSQNSDLTKAAADAHGTLVKWDDSLAAKQKDLDGFVGKIKEQRDLLDSATGLSAQIAPLQAAADAAAKQYADIQETAWRDSRQLQLLRARLRATASTQPSADPMADDLDRQMTNITADINNLQSSQTVPDPAKSRQNLVAVQKKFEDAVAAGQDALKNHPNIADPVQAARELLSHVRDMVDQVSARREQSQAKFEELKRFLERSNRRRQEIVYDADPKLDDLTEELNDVQRQALIQQEIVSALATAPGSTTLPSTPPAVDLAEAPATPDVPAATRPSAGDRLNQLRQAADDLRRQMSARRRVLWQDSSAGLHERLNRIIDTGWTQLSANRQLIAGTLQTVVARLSAEPPGGGVNPADKKVLTNVLALLYDLIRANAQDAAAAVAPSDPQYQAMLALQEQLDDLKDRAAARGDAVAATTRPVDDFDRGSLFATRDEAAARLAGEINAMNSAGDKFIDAAMKSTQVALSIQNAVKAQNTLSALLAAQQTTQGDMQAMKLSREELQQKADAAIDLKAPVEADVMVISDNSLTKFGLAVGAAALILAGFGAMSLKRPQ